MTEEKWLYWDDSVHDPYFNMSMDEVLLSNSEKKHSILDNSDLLQEWDWERPLCPGAPEGPAQFPCPLSPW